MTTRLRELLGKATKGPWVLSPCVNLEIATIHGVERIPTEDGLGQAWVYIKTSGYFDYEPATQTANAALIVEAVNTLPALLDALDEARGALVGVENCLNQMSVTAYNIRLEGTKDWDQIAGGADLYGTRDKVREALSKINEVIK